jgi:uncharacterized repeat protein (TIGR03803 family)
MPKFKTALVIAVSIVCALTLAATQAAQAQTFKVIHDFTGGQDGANPYAGLTMDQAGTLYGTTAGGGATGNGTVFKLAYKRSGWIFTPLYSFQGTPDGAIPSARVIIAPDGSFYGTTTHGGDTGGNCGGQHRGCGTVFNLKPPVTACKTALCLWTETVLLTFHFSNGAFPYGDLVFDQAGNIYGTTGAGGSGQYGTAYELTPLDGGWTQTLLPSPGLFHNSGVIFDKAGNLYGTSEAGGGGGKNCEFNSCGMVYQLSRFGSGWLANTVYAFQGGGDGEQPYAGLVIDSTGNLYGATTIKGSGQGGTVFELTPSGGGWIFKVLYSFAGSGGPRDSLIMDAAGNLYGTTPSNGAYLNGSVFKLQPQSDGSWAYTSLWGFTGGPDGKTPYGGVILGKNGELYGTTYSDGAYGPGVVYEITP